MRILIYGAGVIGSIFSGKLYESGNDVTMLARNKRFEELKNDGLKIKDINKDITEHYPVKVIDKLEIGDAYDYILVTLQFHQVDEVLPVLAGNASQHIIMCVNNPCGYEKWKDYLGERLMIGFPACGGTINNHQTEYYISKGIAKNFQATTFGEINGSNSDRLKTIIRLFSKGGIPSVASRHIDDWQKCHLAIVLPISAAIYKNNGDLQVLAGNKMDLELMIDATREGLTALKELGYKVEPRGLNFYYMPKGLLKLAFSMSFKTKIADISMAKNLNNMKEEMIQLQGEFKRLLKDTTNSKQKMYRLSESLFSVPFQQRWRSLINL